MGYGHDVKERAFQLYYTSGSLSEVTRLLKKTHPKLSKSTVAKWADEKDARGKNWYDRRNDIQVAHNTQVDKTIAQERKKILQETKEWMENINAQRNNLTAKTSEGAINAFTSLSNFYLRESGADRESEETAKEAVSALLVVFKEHKEIGPVLERDWENIEKQFYNALEKIKK